MDTLTTDKVYWNCRILHPDGSLMCYCSGSKINWYLKRGLAVTLPDDPKSIKLTFEPKGRGNANNPFYLQEKLNICVVCATNKNLTKHHCVPYCFRKHFPDHLKSHTSHDVLLLCRECHNKYEVVADQLKKELSSQYDVQLQSRLKNQKFLKYAKTLLRNKDSIPQVKINEMMDAIKEHCNKNIITDADLYNLLKNQEKIDVFKLLVDKLDSIEEFEEMWRQHFIKTMQPKYLPEFWGIGYHKRSHYHGLEIV